MERPRAAIAPVLDAPDSRLAGRARASRPRAPGTDLLHRNRDRLRRDRSALDPPRLAADGRRPQEPRDRGRRRARCRLPRPAPRRHRYGSLADRLDHGGRGRAPDRRGRAGARRRGAQTVAGRGALRLRARTGVGLLPHDDARDPSAPSRGASPGAAARERELPVRPYRGLDRGLLRHRAASHLAADPDLAAGRRLVGRGRDPVLRRLRAHVQGHAPPARLPRRRRHRHRRARRARPLLPGGRDCERRATIEQGRRDRPCGQDPRRRAAGPPARARGARRRRTRSGRRYRKAEKRRSRSSARSSGAPTWSSRGAATGSCSAAST